MFNKNKKTIENLKNNIAKLNENRMELRGENIALQKEVNDLKELLNKMLDNYKESNKTNIELNTKSKGNNLKNIKKENTFLTNKVPGKNTREYKTLEKEVNDWIATDYPKLMKKTKQNQVSLSQILGVSSSSICSINKKDRTTSLELKLRVRNVLTKLAEEA